MEEEKQWEEENKKMVKQKTCREKNKKVLGKNKQEWVKTRNRLNSTDLFFLYEESKQWLKRSQLKKQRSLKKETAS